MAFWNRTRREDARDALLTALLADQTARYTADQQLAAKRAEIELRKEELHLQYAETEAKAKAVEREEAYKLRQMKREAGKVGGVNAQAKRKQQAEEVQCKVCAGEIHLQPWDIAFHHAGHNPQVQLSTDWN